MTAPSGEWGGHTGPLTGEDMLSFGAPDVSVTPVPGGSLGPVTPVTPGGVEPAAADPLATDPAVAGTVAASPLVVGPG